MNYLDEYVEFLKSFWKPDAPVVAVADTSNGSAGPILEKLKSRDLEIVLLNEKPDGNFPAHGPNPQLFSSMEKAGELVRRMKTDFGAVLDGDGDRIIFLDNEGDRMPEEEVAFIISENFRPPFIFDVRMGQLVWGFKRVTSRVGHYFVKKLMKSKKIDFGAETTGHYYFKFRFGGEAAYFDSALRAFLEFGNAVSKLKKEGRTLSSRRKYFPQYFRSGEVNLKITHTEKVLGTLAAESGEKGAKVSRVDGVSVSFPDEKWWFNVRPSNTEPFLRLNMESADPKILKEELPRVKKRILELDK